MRTVNIMNFVRGVEPRSDIDLLQTVSEEIKLNKKYGFENTFLLQYDAMCDPKTVDLFKKEKDDKTELGIWIEMAKPLVEKIGVKWRGRDNWEWDYHVNPGFLPAYTKEQREKIIDEIMAKFKSLFGYYPKTAGSWVLDSYSADYMSEKYDMDAFCICREQWGTDGYTMWGGYYNGPYYASKNNILNPAQSEELQIKAPVIRLLGADPIYCYLEHFKEKYNKIDYSLFTLEPTWKYGQSEKWVDWYLKNLTENEDLGFSYTQTGQENSFYWDDIKKGLPMQFEKLSKLSKEGKIKIEKMCDTGKNFKKTYSTTLPTVYSALDDWAGLYNKSVWYSCKNYRINVFCDKDEVVIRDIHKFDENYRDKYIDSPCTEHSCIYDALPVVDSIRFSDDDTKCGIYFGKGKIESTKKVNDNELEILISANEKKIKINLNEHSVTVLCTDEFEAEFKYKKNTEQIQNISENEIKYSHNGYEYKLILKSGHIRNNKLISENGKTEITFD